LELSRTTGTSEHRAKKAIEEALLAGYTCERNPATGFPAFAFRLHQFISRGDTIYASLESEDQRYLTLNRQQFVPGDRKKVLLLWCSAASAGKSTTVSGGWKIQIPAL
jgi:hypothetical protein